MFYYQQQQGRRQRYVPLRRTEVSRGAHDYHHTPQRQRQLVRELAQKIIRARRVVVLTGAGVSTASGLRDQSSGMHCSKAVKAGPGRTAVRHELAAISRASLFSSGDVSAVANKRTALAARLAQSQGHVGSPAETLPSLAHMSLVTLSQENHVHHVISTNTDGLHWRSGISPAALTTLQGNPYAEACGDCGHQYLRDFLVRAKKNTPRTHKRVRGSHVTGRFCTHPQCNGIMGGGRLYDNMVLPNEAIDSHTMRRALNEITQCDVLLVLGSSLREEPALVCVNHALKYGKRRGEAHKFVAMVSLQQTMHDDAVDLRAHSDVDTFLAQLCSELDAGDPIPYRVRLRVRIGIVYAKDERAHIDDLVRMGVIVPGAELPPHPNGELFCSIEDQNGLPLTCISSLNVRLPEEYAYYGSRRMSTCVDHKSSNGEDWDGRVRCVVDPMAHEGWTQVCLTVRSPGPRLTSMSYKPLYFSYWLGTMNEGESSTAYVLEYDPYLGTWSDEPLSIVEEGVDNHNGYQHHTNSRNAGGSAYIVTDDPFGGNRNNPSRGGGSVLSGGRSSMWSRERPSDFNMDDDGLSSAGGTTTSGGSSIGSSQRVLRTRGGGGTGGSSSYSVLSSGGGSEGRSGGRSGGGGAMVTFSALPATRVATAELGSGTMDGMFPSPSRAGTAEDRLPKTPTIRQMGDRRRSSSPVMEDLLDRAVSSSNVEELVHRLSRPSMISGSDMPLKRLTLSGAEKFHRPSSESMNKRNQQQRLEDLMQGKKVSKERRHSIVNGKGRELMKPQGYRRVATAVPMSSKKQEPKEAINDDGDITAVNVNYAQEAAAKVRTTTPQVNYYGYSTQ
jgi:NAD-dependent SIR2 family protein deacetylase